ncbi:MAG: glycoside hydrolase family 2 TIM barrel-domain containing protein [Armatimonadota bacterium]
MNILMYGQIGIIAATLLSAAPGYPAQSAWKPAPCNIPTPWSDKVDPANTLPEYPRPQMERTDWQNLNGLWDYSETAKDAPCPQNWDGKILVPFGIESSLSGVKKALQPDQRLWYRRDIEAKSAWLDGKHRLLLHFGAVDWQCQVYINNKLIGEHKGGYDPFTFDITDAVKPGNNEIKLSVWDPTNSVYAALGKQALVPSGAKYTSTSGIWQTAWLEPLPKTYISDIKMVPDIAAGALNLKVNVEGSSEGYQIEATALAGGVKVGSVTGPADKLLLLKVPNARLWSPDDPFLYDLNVVMRRNGKTVDSVKSYFGMRSIQIAKDASGYDRIMLNGKSTFNLGVLDQGFWPDGIYTAPTDEALRFDIEAVKKMGFNTIRKHVKVEPDRWYYYCDKLGMLVWQDVVSRTVILKKETDQPEYDKQFESEIKAMIDSYSNHPSIIMWVLFNESWGMYDTKRIATWMKDLDPSRLLNAHTGGNDEGAGDISDAHVYCYAGLPGRQEGKASVVGEFGGVNVLVRGHEWQAGTQWGHGKVNSADFAFTYQDIINRLKPMIVSGLCGAIYTQPYDVEIEENGLITYDRKVFKIPPEWASIINNSVYGYASSKVSYVLAKSGSNWRYVAEKPSDDWSKPEFDDSSWAAGTAPFGENGGRTGFTGSDIWMRQSFEIKDAVKNPYFAISNSGQTEIYIDGQLVGGAVGGVYGQCVLLPAFTCASSALTPGKHIIAVHCRRAGDKPVDIGIADVQ